MYFNKINQEDINDGKYKGNQRNIMMIVGNGFDIDVLNSLSNKNGQNRDTSYESFVRWLENKNSFKLNNNLLFQKLQSKDPQRNKMSSSYNRNWADIEENIKLIVEDSLQHDDSSNTLIKLKNNLKEIQKYFAKFLHERITPDINLDVVEKANPDSDEKPSISSNKKDNYPVNAVANFLKDLTAEDYQMSKFTKYQVSHKASLNDNNGELGFYTLYDWLFINLNYTSLFDNCFDFNKKFFNPAIHDSTQTNFVFCPASPKNNRGYLETGNKKIAPGDIAYSSYLVSNILHPHRKEWVPDSMLFGFSSIEQFNSYEQHNCLRKELNEFIKPTWSASDLKYRPLFRKTNLFIIYGASLGKSDAWWWNQIMSQLIQNDDKSHYESELIIYNYLVNDNERNYMKVHNESELKKVEEGCKKKFIESALSYKHAQETIKVKVDSVYEKIKDKIFVVNYDNDVKKVAFTFPRSSKR